MQKTVSLVVLISIVIISFIAYVPIMPGHNIVNKWLLVPPGTSYNTDIWGFERGKAKQWLLEHIKDDPKKFTFFDGDKHDKLFDTQFDTYNIVDDSYTTYKQNLKVWRKKEKKFIKIDDKLTEMYKLHRLITPSFDGYSFFTYNKKRYVLTRMMCYVDNGWQNKPTIISWQKYVRTAMHVEGDSAKTFWGLIITNPIHIIPDKNQKPICYFIYTYDKEDPKTKNSYHAEYIIIKRTLNWDIAHLALAQTDVMHLGQMHIQGQPIIAAPQWSFTTKLYQTYDTYTRKHMWLYFLLLFVLGLMVFFAPRTLIIAFVAGVLIVALPVILTLNYAIVISAILLFVFLALVNYATQDKITVIITKIAGIILGISFAYLIYLQFLPRYTHLFKVMFSAEGATILLQLVLALIILIVVYFLLTAIVSTFTFGLGMPILLGPLFGAVFITGAYLSILVAHYALPIIIALGYFGTVFIQPGQLSETVSYTSQQIVKTTETLADNNMIGKLKERWNK